jgi:hypothetical protein
MQNRLGANILTRGSDVGVIIIVLALLIIGNIATSRFASAFDLFIKKVPLYSTRRQIKK